MIKEAIEKLMQAENLTYDQVKESVDEIMTGQASPALIASFLTALSIKGKRTRKSPEPPSPCAPRRCPWTATVIFWTL